MTSSWPTGSSRRGCGALDSGTNGPVGTIAATPTGMFPQKTPRQPTDAISSPPTTGPRARLTPTAAPQTPMARARSARSVNVFTMMDMATGLSMEPPPEPVRGGAGQQQQAGQHQRVGVHHPLQPGHRGVQVPLDGRQRDIHDRVVQAHDDQAHAADDED